MLRRAAALGLIAIAACRGGGEADEGARRGSGSAGPGADDLAAYLSTLAGRDGGGPHAELAGWTIDEGLGRRVLVDPYRALAGAAAAAARTTLEEIEAQLQRGGTVTARRHFAGDPKLTPSQARLRWALPVMAPSFVAEIRGTPIDTVFVHDSVRWRALAGLDEVLVERVHARDRACVHLLAGVTESRECASAGWAIADATLRTPEDPTRLARACRIAANVCGKRSP